MDRFIGQGSGITYDTTTDLKSNMDRFIEVMNEPVSRGYPHLKSNMDRFIGIKRIQENDFLFI